MYGLLRLKNSKMKMRKELCASWPCIWDVCIPNVCGQLRPWKIIPFSKMETKLKNFLWWTQSLLWFPPPNRINYIYLDLSEFHLRKYNSPNIPNRDCSNIEVVATKALKRLENKILTINVQIVQINDQKMFNRSWKIWLKNLIKINWVKANRYTCNQISYYKGS